MKVKWWIATGFVNAKHSGVWDIDDGEWERMTDKERGDHLDYLMDCEVQMRIDSGYEVQS